MENSLLTDKLVSKYPKLQNSILLFLKQCDALEYCRVNSENLSVFAIEVGSGGQRQFLVSNDEDFWSMYQSKKVKNFYEVIPLFRKSKLYFDLEFSKTLNPHKDSEFMVRRLIGLVKEKLRSEYEFKIEDHECLCLESSNESKFSVHLIFYSVLFASNLECGAFVKRVLNQMTEENKACFQVSSFRAKDSSIDHKSFVDVAVYSKNRNLRLYLSSKKAQFRPLLLSPMDVSSTTINNSSTDSFEKEVFKRSLITCNYEQTNQHEVKKLTLTPDFTTKIAKKTAFTTSNAPARNNSCNDDTVPTAVKNTILKLISPGRIRNVAYLDKIVCYNIDGRTFCEFKNGNHTSDKQVYFVYRLQDKVLVQKCFSSKCRNLTPIPINIMQDST